MRFALPQHLQPRCWALLASTSISLTASVSFAQQPPQSPVRIATAQQGQVVDLSNVVAAAPQANGAGQSVETSIVQSDESDSQASMFYQGRIPRELILPPPSEEAKALARQFVKAEIDPQLPLVIVVGRPKIIQLNDNPIRMFMPNEHVAQAEILNQGNGREIAITGVRSGTTTLTLWFSDPNKPGETFVLSYLVEVYNDPNAVPSIDQLESVINKTFSGCSVELEDISGQLVIKGQAKDATQVVQILNLLLGARNAEAARARKLTTTSSSQTIIAQANFNEVRLDEDRQEVTTIEPAQLSRAGIVNLLQVPGEQQVMLRVTVAEVNRSAARSIGLNFSVQDGANNLVSRPGRLFQNINGNQGGGNIGPNLLASIDSGQVRLAIDALRTMQLSKTLAEPNLVAINGSPANFRAGGQFPVPIISAGGVGAGQNLQGVSFIPFGISLQFVPLIQDRDIIRLSLNAEVSTRDESIGTTIGGAAGGTAVAGLNSRNVSTNVELRSGQTLAVAGILQTNLGASSDRIPFFGDIPLLGALSGVNRSSSGEQELVILVTPELVAPVDACNAPGLPGQDVHEPTDIEFFVKNRLESRRSTDYRASVRTDWARQRRPDECCPDRYIIGSIGPTDRACNQLVPVPHETLIQTTASPSLPPVMGTEETTGGSR